MEGICQRSHDHRKKPNIASCCYCGKEGHFSRHCWNSPKYRGKSKRQQEQEEASWRKSKEHDECYTGERNGEPTELEDRWQESWTRSSQRDPSTKATADKVMDIGELAYSHQKKSIGSKRQSALAQGRQHLQRKGAYGWAFDSHRHIAVEDSDGWDRQQWA